MLGNHYSAQVTMTITADCSFTVQHLAAGQRDAAKFLSNDGQYLHLVDAAQPLTCWGDPSLTASMDIAKLTGNLWCFIECGGVLGNLTVRGFFGVSTPRHEVIVTGYEKVQYEGRTRPHVIWKNEGRLNYYEENLTSYCSGSPVIT